jgi:quercetin dioxygenase-like cupin family protein
MEHAHEASWLRGGRGSGLWPIALVGGLALGVLAIAIGPHRALVQHHAMQAHMAPASADAERPAASARPATVVRPIACERLPNVPGKSITTVLVDFPPGAFTPRHRHPGSVTAYVVSGTIRSQLAGGPPGTFGPGTTWFEPPGAIHLFAENASATDPARVLATFVADDDCGALTIFGD